jgi:predicted DCC family thiol-disulfide oxidoreductase YuxK
MATAQKRRDLDFSDFPPGTVNAYTRLVCLACIFDLFTKQLGLAPRTAYSEIKRHAPTAEELTAGVPARPYFDSVEKHPRCPYCDAAKRWHARLDTFRIESGKATDAPRRALVKSLPKAEEQFVLIESRSTKRDIFFSWLDALGRELDFTDDAWLITVTRHMLERKEPKTNWADIFERVRGVRRSQRLAEGWEHEGTRLYLSPPLYADALLIQYLVSRSQAHGGITFEGRLTLVELVRRLRYSGQLEAQGITERGQFEVLEQLIENLTGGTAAAKLYFLVDRRDFLDKVKTVYSHYA